MIKDNIARVKERISKACERSGRDPSQVAIVGISKGRSVEEMGEAVAAGINDIGENRVQEALLKYNALARCPFSRYPLKQATGEQDNGQTIKWHMVGHLQTNKVKDAVRIFGLIQSVDSLRLAQTIDKEAAEIGKIQDILVEVKISPEATKFGVKPEETAQLLEEISKFRNIRVNGLMTIAPLADDAEKARPYFRLLRELRDRIYDLRITDYELRILSMGMSDDFEVAIEEGSTMVRIGRAIFS